jgi:hypothetical protein
MATARAGFGGKRKIRVSGKFISEGIPRSLISTPSSVCFLYFRSAGQRRTRLMGDAG